MQFIDRTILLAAIMLWLFGGTISAQTFRRDFPVGEGATIEIYNRFGRVEAVAEKDAADDDAANDNETNAAKTDRKVFLTVEAKGEFSENDLKTDSSDGKIRIEVAPAGNRQRIDLKLKMPPRMRLKISTGAGEAIVSGDFALAEIQTETGTISADVPLDNLKYDFLWTESRPRFLSDVALKDVKEKAAGKFAVSGKLAESSKFRDQSSEIEEEAEQTNEADTLGDESDRTADQKQKTKSKKQKSKLKNQIKLDFTTARGIILLNVPISEVSGDLRERPLTNAAKAIVRGGDSLLLEAIRRASPKYFGEYSQTLAGLRREPDFKPQSSAPNAINSPIKKVLVSVTDINNRAISDLKSEDFTVSESGAEREILAVESSNAPFNLVLLLDVSGSVDNYVNFIRKAARSFVKTVDRKDKIAVVIFNDDIKVISNFTTDKTALSASLDTFDAGGGTAYYDALGYALSETLRPLKGERTAIVALTDGDDNKSFLPFDALLGSIQESGALIYPLYVPSSLIAAGSAATSVDPLRTKYLGLTTKAEGEGEKLAKISGGVYYPITRLDELQKAYDDIVLQLRTAYTVTFRSDLPETADKQTASPRLKVRVKRENSFVKLGSVTAAANAPTSQVRKFPAKAQRTQSEELNFAKTDFAQERLNFALAVYQTNNPENFFSSFANFAPSRETFFNAQSAEISGNVERVNYKQFLGDKLKESKFESFDINKSQGAFLLNNGQETIAVSRWISPKRTRSYPYERVYDTLTYNGKKVTIIPVVKDEGAGGERDFLQWDTISLLSLLDVHVVLAYYDSAVKNEKRGDQITAQKFDNSYINARLTEIFAFKGTSREWNEREIKQLKPVFEKAKLSYQKIAKDTQTYLHNQDAIDELIKYAETPEKFLEFSRGKSKKAQSREFVTEQPKEALSTDTKAKVTINNALFGKYFFTCDETRLDGKNIYLIEAKHSVRAKMPSKNDIKDGFVKMMLYTAMTGVKVGAKPFDLKVQIRLTSNQMKGSTNSDEKDEIIAKFITENAFTVAETNFIKKLFEEARTNKFTIILEHAETAK